MYVTLQPSATIHVFGPRVPLRLLDDRRFSFRNGGRCRRLKCYKCTNECGTGKEEIFASFRLAQPVAQGINAPARGLARRTGRAAVERYVPPRPTSHAQPRPGSRSSAASTASARAGRSCSARRPAPARRRLRSSLSSSGGSRLAVKASRCRAAAALAIVRPVRGVTGCRAGGKALPGIIVPLQSRRLFTFDAGELGRAGGSPMPSRLSSE
jgi:hypothetical protein